MAEMKNMQFELDWLIHNSKAVLTEELLTRCYLSLNHGNRQLLRHEDLLGNHQVKDAIVVSAYPLAHWFAANWWRLRWEPSLSSASPACQQDWNMSHHVAAAGSGYAWPNLVFTSDGDNIRLAMAPRWAQGDPVRYIETLDTWVPAHEFEACIDQFIEQTLAQLKSGKEHTELEQLWRILTEERNSPDTSLQRQLEARLGYDPEEAPEAFLSRLTALVVKHGESAVQELASLGQERAEQTINDACQRLADTHDSIRLPLRNIAKVESLLTGDRPWVQGREAAQRCRTYLSLDKGPLNNRIFAELLETRVQLLEDQNTACASIGIGEVAANGRAKVVLGKKRKDARRFMAARLIAEAINGTETGKWLPCTNTATIRQKYQRAFAQEFLCPYQDLVEWMDTTAPDEELMEAAAEHFEVSPLMINTVMVNHGHIPRTELETFQQIV